MRSLFKHRLFNIASVFCFGYALVSLLLIFSVDTTVLGINAFIKPMKFGVSAGILFLTFSWYFTFIPRRLYSSFNRFAWVNVGVMAFELSWILVQAVRGTLSHFNTNTPFEGIMFGIMGVSIAISTAWTLLLLRWTWFNDFRINPGLLWALRFSILYFVIFGFTGFIMGAQGAHTVGEADGGAGIPILNWSLQHGDLRISHFLGLHAMQILPILAWLFKLRPVGSFILSAGYGALCFYLLTLALNGVSPL